ncbi:MAG TPA: glycosyl hydrolase family 28-related protein, partial [Verrucomicrobiae bacterium]|nr:glycosyl hydrolase family 28-related protein [Verrucomicrobiae bacterium]
MTRRTYLTALTGTLAAAEAAETLDLSAFGIKADGATDDTAAIQKALDAAAKTGATVLLPPARYMVAGNLKIPPG